MINTNCSASNAGGAARRNSALTGDVLAAEGKGDYHSAVSVQCTGTGLMPPLCSCFQGQRKVWMAALEAEGVRSI